VYEKVKTVDITYGIAIVEWLGTIMIAWGLKSLQMNKRYA